MPGIGNHLKGLSTEERKAMMTKNLIKEYQGIKVGDPVKLLIPAVPKDHKAVVDRIRKESNTHEICFWILLDSEESRAVGESWGPLWASEIEKV